MTKQNYNIETGAHHGIDAFYVELDDFEWPAELSAKEIRNAFRDCPNITAFPENIVVSPAWQSLTPLIDLEDTEFDIDLS